MPTSIDVVPQGWWALADADSFYPDDLPREWQLTYFANVFPAVLVPGPLWQQRSEDELASWHADVHPGFRFYLELTSSNDDGARSRAMAAFGAALIAFVAEAPESRGTEPVAARAGALIAPHTGNCIGASRHCPPRLNENLRDARGWLDAQTEPPRPEPLRTGHTRSPALDRIGGMAESVTVVGAELAIMARRHAGNRSAERTIAPLATLPVGIVPAQIA